MYFPYVCLHPDSDASTQRASGEKLVSPAAQGISHSSNAFAVSSSQDQTDAVAKLHQALRKGDSSTSDASTSYPTPEGYSYVFGPIDAANNADGVSARFSHLRGLMISPPVYGICRSW